jgi:Mg-chelatase subunit ChlD
MNPDTPQSPHQELEARLTALLLGELSDEEAAALRRVIEQDADLARLYERLKQTIDLAREASTNPTEQTAAQPAPLRLPEERRQKLLAHFKTVSPREFVPPRRREMPWFVPMSAAAVLVATIGATLLAPQSVSRRERLSAGSDYLKRGQVKSGAGDDYSYAIDAAGQPATVTPPVTIVTSSELRGFYDADGEKNVPATPIPATENKLAVAKLPERAKGVPSQAEALEDRLAKEPAVATLSGSQSVEEGRSVVATRRREIVLPSGNEPAGSANQWGGLAGGGGSGGAQGKSGLNDVEFGHAVIDRGSEALSLERSERNAPAGNGRIDVQGGAALSFAEGAPPATPVPAKPTAETAVALRESERIAAFANSDATPGARTENLFALGDLAVPGAQPRPDATTADAPHYYNRLMKERYGLLPNAPPPPAKGETTTPAPTEYKLAPTSTSVPQTAGRDLSTWAADQSGVVVANEFVSGLDRTPVQKVPQKMDLAYDVNRGLEQGAARGREAAGASVDAADYFKRSAQPANPAVVAAEEPARRKPSPIALPPSDPVANGRTISDLKPRQADVLTDSRSTLDGLDRELGRRNEEVAQAQASVDELRQKLKISDTGQAGFASTLEPEPVRRLEAERAETAKTHAGLEMLLEEAKNKPKESVKEMLLKTVNDETLASAAKQLEAAQRDLARLNTPVAAQAAEAVALQSKVKELTEKVDARVGDLVSGLELKEQAAKAQIESLDASIKTVRDDDAAKTRAYRPYFEAKRELENLQKVRDAVIVRILQETVDASLPKTSEVEIVADTKALEEKLVEQDKEIARAGEELQRVERESKNQEVDDDRFVAPRKPASNAPIPQPEIQTHDNAWSTFSLNVSDVSFKLAAASLEKGSMPEPASVRSEEFINAFDYRDPEPPPGVPIAFAWERARYPFAHNRDLLRFSVKTAAAGRQLGRPLNVVLLVDNSGSMERADRARIIHEALRVLAAQLQPQDKLSVITFARTPRLWVDGAPGNQAGEVAEQVSGLTPQGGTNLEDAMNLAYQTALRHYLAEGVNRVVLLTDGAANLGDVEPESLKQKVEAHRKQGIALDCFGIGWEGFNDDLLEVLSRNGDGRYGFINSPEEAATEFAGQLAGALQVAASDVKVQVEFNPRRVTAYRQIGYAKHQLTKEQFRDNTVDAAEIAAAEAGNALYAVEANPAGVGPLAIVRVRFKVPGTADYREHEWAVPFTGNAAPLEHASSAMRLAATASAFSEWLVSSPFAGEVTPDRLLGYLSGVPEIFGADARPKKLEWMIRQAKSIAGK